MIYKVIGLMSGSSLDGLDIVYAQLEEVRGKWAYEILQAECLPYSTEWQRDLKGATAKGVPDFLRLHTAYGRHIGTCVQDFIDRHELVHKVHFVVSHGHTVFHEPASRTTCQIGDGAAIAAVTGLPVICDLRALDIALDGQGAPIVPVGDQLLFGDYDLLLNIGGIANMTTRDAAGNYTACDITVANQALNYLAAKAGKLFDENGDLAAAGQLIEEALRELSAHDYYTITGPKALSNEAAMQLVADFLDEEQWPLADRLHTVCALIVAQTDHLVKQTLGDATAGKKMLVTGGGALNTFLVSRLQQQLATLGIDVVVPDTNVVLYKEALVMALLGILRWREEPNVMAGVTGARKDSVGGAFWIGA
jgi:anhydro-N-acetylmuramic acid kinase